MQILNVLPKCSKVSCCTSQMFDFIQKGGYDAKEDQNPLPKLPNHVKILRSLAPPLMAVVLNLSPLGYPPDSLGQTVDVQRGSSLFRTACIGCHDGGGNIIQPGATLFLNDLQRNGVDSDDKIYQITYYGKGRMPGFGENCTPRGQCTFGARLKDDDIKVLAEFVKLQADQGWPNLVTSED